MAVRAYAIGDVHGQDKKLARAHALIAADRARTGAEAAPVVHVGDLVDRGPDSPAVIDRLLAAKARGENWIALRGNHDDMMARALHPDIADDAALDAWVGPGMSGGTTLAAYGIDIFADWTVGALRAAAGAAIPRAHLDFLAGLPALLAMGDLFFCHAGIRPGIALERQEAEDLIWIREPFLSSTMDHGALVVHGHTPGERVMHCGNRLNLDSGAGFGGPLSAVAIEAPDRVFLLSETGREPVVPPARG